MRKKNLVLGTLIILVGLALLLNQIFPYLSLGKYIFPTILILIGLWFLLGPRLLKHDLKDEHYNIPLDGAAGANIKLRHGAGRLSIEASDTSNDLLQGDFIGGVEKDINRRGEEVSVRLKSPSDAFMSIPALHHGGLNWNLYLNRHIPINLDVKGGANETKMDLEGLKVTDLRLETGASSTEITLPASAGFTQVEVNAGAASITIRVPKNVAARISTRESSMASISIDQYRFPANQGIFETPGYGDAANKANIIIKAGVGSIDVQ